MRINQRWHQILGTCDGVALSATADCNAFALETGAGLVLFDAGAGMGETGALPALAAAGFPDDLQHLFLTHAHADHAGGAALLAARYGMPIHAGSLTAQWLAAGDEDKLSLPGARAAGIYPPDYRLRPVAVDRIVAEKTSIRIGDAEIVPLATPGHSLDHWSYLVRIDGSATLVAGDAIFAGGKIVLQDTWDSGVAESCASIRKLAALEFDAFLPGHGPLVLAHAPEHLEAAMQRIDRLLPPLNFV